MTSPRRQANIGCGQTPFLVEYHSPLVDAENEINPTFQTIYEHVEECLDRLEEHPLLDAPFDEMGDHWRILKDTEISRKSLHFLADDAGQGLGISPTGAFLMLS